MAACVLLDELQGSPRSKFPVAPTCANPNLFLSAVTFPFRSHFVAGPSQTVAKLARRTLEYSVTYQRAIDARGFLLGYRNQSTIGNCFDNFLKYLPYPCIASAAQELTRQVLGIMSIRTVYVVSNGMTNLNRAVVYLVSSRPETVSGWFAQ